MVAHVVPYTRTIRGKDWFDYSIPEGMGVAVGHLVEIDFRQKRLPGLVLAVTEQANATKLKPILRILPHAGWQSVVRQQLLRWLASYYGISLPHGLKILQYPLLKRPRQVDLDSKADRPIKISSAKLPKSAATRLKAALSQPPTTDQPEVVHYSERTDCLAFYRGLLAHRTGHCLIVVPDYFAMAEVRSFLPDPDLICLPEAASPSFFQALSERLSSARPCTVVATKQVLALNLEPFSTIVIDHEEAKSHRQYDQNPRLNLRTVLLHYASLRQQLGQPLRLILTAQSPSITVAAQVEAGEISYLDLRRPGQPSQIELVDMEQEQQQHNYTWFSNRLVEQIGNSRHAMVFFNRAGTFGAALCLDCSTLLAPQTTQCTHCGGANIRSLRKGIAQLERELRLLFPTKRILRVDRDQDAATLSPEHLAHAEIVIATEKIFSLARPEDFDLVGILSVDHMLVYPHFRSQERVFGLLIRLFSSNVPVILQTHVPSHPVIVAAQANDYWSFSRAELALRRALHLPPFGTRIRLLQAGGQVQQELTTEPDWKSLPSGLLVDRQDD